MNDQSDELAQSLAQSVTRRAALKKFGVGFGRNAGRSGLAPRILWFLLLPLALTVRGQSPTADSFNPGAATHDSNVGLYVYSVAVQADGKVLVGGIFDTLGGQNRTNIGRVNPDGSPDLEFYAAVGGSPYAEVLCLAVQPDGKILVGGGFTTVNGQPRTNIARLNADGTLDAGFDPGASADSAVTCMAVQRDGKTIVGGWFYWLGGEEHPCIGRLNADGTVDHSFQSSASDAFFAPGVQCLALQPDGKILVGGRFGFLNEERTGSLGRLNADGTLDETFIQNVVGSVTVDGLALQADGKILVSDWWGSINRVDADGYKDASFNAQQASGSLIPIAIQADGKILVSGSFTTIGGLSQTNLARLNTDGTLDPGFGAGTDHDNNAWVLSLFMQADGKIVVVGSFSMLAGQSRTNIGRLNATAPAAQSLTFDGSTLTWTRGGTSPEVWRTTFDHLDGAAWIPLGAGVRMSGGWELSGLSLPTNVTIRARGFVGTGGIGDSFVETVLNPPLTVADARVSAGYFAFNALGPAGLAVVIDSSTDLKTWAPLQTVTLGVGPYTFTDTQTASPGKRFYRVRKGP